MSKIKLSANNGHDTMRNWRIQDALDLYGIDRWGEGYFHVNEKGHIEIRPSGEAGPRIDLKELVDALVRRGIELPMLIRFGDILRHRIATLHGAFQRAIDEYSYGGHYIGAYPIKVNQQHQVVEEIVRCGRAAHFGLEAGSKPELLAVLALHDSPDAPIICNGYKDNEFIEMVLLASKLGRRIIPVVEKFSELELILAAADRLDVKPSLGLRVKLSSRGAGRWEGSGGDRSKFGLTIIELVRAIEYLRASDALDWLKLVHFHLGSQITNIRAIRDGLEEACRIFVELAKSGADLRYIDVGGGLAVDYDGSRTNFHSSANYTIQEYANDVVAHVMDACDNAGVPHPIIVSESGRALVAHHSVLLFNVLGTSELATTTVPESLPDDAPDVLHNLHECLRGISRKNIQEAFHDAMHYREEAMTLFKLGYLSLVGRSQVESLFWACCQRILKIVRDLEYVPEELQPLERALSDTYFCNFSTFQSVPDFWAVGQLFPVVPIHRLDEAPTQRATIADVTCDSDGKIDRFIDLRDVKDVLELHRTDGEDYVIGMFLTGAYQEILGDMHNLFGDTNAVHVSVDEDGEYQVDHVIKGDTIKRVLGYVEYEADDLINRLRRSVENAVRKGRISLEESAYFLRRYERGLEGYTYLSQRSTDYRNAAGQLIR
ncbi:MAG: biosynthetic arginine decarboxylase [Phycisphaerae bacterium]|nr:biosynthetic arginine decarboxylase [Phycisphaerae bacterium]